MTVITDYIPLKKQSFSSRFYTYGLREDQNINLSPCLIIDLFNMSLPTFPPPPHAGFSAVTYMLPESPGSFQNRDSLGGHNVIEPGSIHWTQAANGMMHEEIPTLAGKDGLGFQIFFNLSAEKKHKAPQAFHINVQDVHKIETDGGSVRLLCGHYHGLPLALPEIATDVTLLDFTLKHAASITFEKKPTENAFLFLFGGTINVNSEGEYDANAVLKINDTTESLTLKSMATTSGFLLIKSPALEQPSVWSGPFNMTNKQELSAAKLRYQQGEMGHLSASF